jgi:ABC-type spermidine/putrescine transport system permease subunit II
MLEESPDDGSVKQNTAQIGLQRSRQSLYIALAIVGLLIVIVGISIAVAYMVQNPAQTELLRDIVIILMAVEFLLLGLALLVLIVQIARLTALLETEIRPILETTNETLNTLRGTTTFLSDNLVQPVIKANSSLSAVRRALDLLRFGRSR